MKLRMPDQPSVEGVYHLRSSETGHRVAFVQNKADAKAITVAVNAYDDLSRALETMLSAYDKINVEEETRFCDDRMVVEFEQARSLLGRLREKKK